MKWFETQKQKDREIAQLKGEVYQLRRDARQTREEIITHLKETVTRDYEIRIVRLKDENSHLRNEVYVLNKVLETLKGFRS